MWLGVPDTLFPVEKSFWQIRFEVAGLKTVFVLYDKKCLELKNCWCFLLESLIFGVGQNQVWIPVLSALSLSLSCKFLCSSHSSLLSTRHHMPTLQCFFAHSKCTANAIKKDINMWTLNFKPRTVLYYFEVSCKWMINLCNLQNTFLLTTCFAYMKS